MNLRTKITLALLALISLPGILTFILNNEQSAPTANEAAIAREIETRTLPLLATGNIIAVDTELARIQNKYPEIKTARITFESQDHETTNRLTGLATAANEHTYPLRNIGQIHLETTAPRTTNRTTQFLTFLLISLAITGLAGLFITTRILRPIHALSKAAHELSLGNFNAKATIKTGDELEELANVFNKTSEALSKIDSERKQIDSAKTRFLSITSHELRSPMTPMKAQLQMLEAGYFGKLNNEQKDSISMVIRNADRLDTIIADFLEISRIEAARLKFTFRKANLAETVRETAAYMKGFMPEKKITLKLDVQKLQTIETDPDRVAQVLRNLLSNAIKFSPKNATVTITAKQLGNTIQFSVSDQGIGIAPKDQLKLFEPFFQAEQTIYREGKGVGLGLAICRGIVLSQNGKIWLDSKPNKGTTFHFTIPLEPVHDIKPIRVLFSSKEQIEKKLRETFNELLGPIGASEFEDLQDKLTLEHLKTYVDDLHSRTIIDKEIAEQFKHKMNHIFLGTDHETKL